MTRTERTRRSDARAQRVAVVAAAAAVAALAIGGTALKLAAPGSDASPASSAALAGGSRLPADSVTLDLGAVTDAADVAACLVPEFATDPAEVTVVYGQVQKTRDGRVPVLVLRNTAGVVRLCDAFGGDFPSQAPLDTASTADPVVFYSAGRRDWNCQEDSHTLRRFTATEWLSVAGAVDTVRARFVVDGTAGPWFTTRAANGLAHLQAWLDGPVQPGTRIVVQHQVLDAAGYPVPQTVLPGRQRLPGCSAGSASIG